MSQERNCDKSKKNIDKEEERNKTSEKINNKLETRVDNKIRVCMLICDISIS